MNPEFKLLDADEIYQILPLLAKLDESIPMPILQSRLNTMIDSGYECVGIYVDSELIGMCGIWTQVKYYVGKHIEPDNVYIDPSYRDQGLGSQLAEWLEDLAQSRGCEALELNCYLTNKAGQKFWETCGYTAIGLHYQKKLTG